MAHEANFEIIEQSGPILTMAAAAAYFDITRSAPTLIVKTDRGLMAVISSYGRGRLNFAALKDQLGLRKMKMADREAVFAQIGYRAGTVPPICHGLPCIFDDRLLAFDYVYGGTGDELRTLKISPHDLKRLNDVIGTME